MSHDCCGHQHDHNQPTALRFAEIFCPDTVIYADRVYFDTPDDDDYQELLEFTEQDLVSVQVLFNHRHLLDLYGDEHASRADLIAFGLRLQSCWDALLRARYPERVITVAFDPQDEDTLDELQIMIYEDIAA